MAWTKRHLDIIKRLDVEGRTHTQNSEAQLTRYPGAIEQAMSGTLDEAMCNPTLAELFNTLQSEPLRIVDVGNVDNPSPRRMPAR